MYPPHDFVLGCSASKQAVLQTENAEISLLTVSAGGSQQRLGALTRKVRSF